MTQLNNTTDLDSYSAISENFNNLNRTAVDIRVLESTAYLVTFEFQFYCIGSKNIYDVITNINTGTLSQKVSEQLLNRNTSFIEISRYEPDQEAITVANNLLQLNVYTPDDQEIVPAVSITAGIDIVSYWS